MSDDEQLQLSAADFKFEYRPIGGQLIYFNLD